MSSAIHALTGEFESCWYVLVDTDGTESGEKTLIVNAIGWDGMVSEITEKGHSVDSILHYTNC